MKTLNYISFIQKYSVYSTCQIYAELAIVHLQWLPKPTLGFPGGTSGQDPACQCKRLQRCSFDPWVGKIPWRREWQPTPAYLPGKSHEQRSLAGYSPCNHKESDRTEVTGLSTPEGNPVLPQFDVSPVRHTSDF